MKHVDMRKLAPAEQEERRRQVTGLRQSVSSHAAIAAQVGWHRQVERRLALRIRGRPGIRAG